MLCFMRQAELAMTAAELRDKSRELAETQRALRKRDGEVMGLKAMISRKDENLKQARAFLVEARVQVQVCFICGLMCPSWLASANYLLAGLWAEVLQDCELILNLIRFPHIADDKMEWR